MEDDGSVGSLLWERVAHITIRKDGEFKLITDRLSDKEIEFLKREIIKYEKLQDKTGLLSPVQMLFRDMELNKIENISLIYESRGFTRFANCLARMVEKNEM